MAVPTHFFKIIIGDRGKENSDTKLELQVKLITWYLIWADKIYFQIFGYTVNKKFHLDVHAQGYNTRLMNFVC